MRISKENPQRAGQTYHRPRTELLCRSSDESGDHGQCQRAEIAAAHLMKIALEPAQVMLVVVDRAWAKASLFTKILEEPRYLSGKRLCPRSLVRVVITLRHDQAEEMPDGATQRLRSHRRASAGRSRRRADNQSTTNASRSISARSTESAWRAAVNSANSVRIGTRRIMLRAEYPCSHRAIT